MSKFLFDLDETIYKGDIIKEASDRLISEDHNLSKVYHNEDITTFPDMDGIPNIVKDKVKELFSDPFAAAINKKPISGSILLLKYLQLCGHEIGFLTARPSAIHEATRYVIYRDFIKNGISIDENNILFCNMNGYCDKNTSKKELIRDFQPYVYFDDYFKYCEEAKDLRFISHVYMISNKYTPWNYNDIQKAKELGIKIIRNVTQLDEGLL